MLTYKAFLSTLGVEEDERAKWNAKYPNAQLGVMYCQLPYIEQRKSSGMKEANLNVKMSPIGICSLQKQILERA